MSDKPWIVWTTARTGSQLFSRVVGQYLISHHGYKDYLGEYFKRKDRATGRGLSSTRAQQLCKLEWLKNSPDRHFLKVHPNHIHPIRGEAWDWFEATYQFFFLERSPLDQLFSFATSRATNSWFKGRIYDRECWRFEREWFDWFIWSNQRYNEAKSLVPHRLVNYKQFASADDQHNAILRAAGFEPLPVNCLILPTQNIYPYGRLHSFRNSDEVMRWTQEYPEIFHA